MISKIKQALTIKDIRKKLLFTFFMIIVFRLGTTIPVPGIDTSVIKNMVEKNSLLGLYNMFSGGAFSHYICLGNWSLYYSIYHYTAFNGGL